MTTPDEKKNNNINKMTPFLFASYFPFFFWRQDFSVDLDPILELALLDHFDLMASNS